VGLSSDAPEQPDTHGEDGETAYESHHAAEDAMMGQDHDQADYDDG
jgi:hypothetical protein